MYTYCYYYYYDFDEVELEHVKRYNISEFVEYFAKKYHFSFQYLFYTFMID